LRIAGELNHGVGQAEASFLAAGALLSYRP
jgi:hypothetical protein